MYRFKKYGIVLKVISIIGVALNSYLLVSCYISMSNLFTLIMLLICLISLYYPTIIMRKADRNLAEKEIIDAGNGKLEEAMTKHEVEIPVEKDYIVKATDNNTYVENEINTKIIDELRLKNIELSREISEINKIHDEKIEYFKLELDSLEDRHKSNLEEVKNQYIFEIDSLKHQIEEISLWTNEKRNSLKEEALFEYLSLIKEDYRKKLNDSDSEEVEDDVVFTYVAGVKHKNSYGQSRQKLIKNYVKEYHNCDIFDKDDYDYVSDKDIEDAYDNGWEKKYYQYELEEFDTINLVREPENPYDEHAIAIIHEKMGHIGYIPRKHIYKVKKLMDCGRDLSFKIILNGGRYKYYDGFEEKIKTASNPYYFDLIIETL